MFSTKYSYSISIPASTSNSSTGYLNKRSLLVWTTETFSMVRSQRDKPRMYRCGHQKVSIIFVISANTSERKKNTISNFYRYLQISTMTMILSWLLETNWSIGNFLMMYCVVSVDEFLSKISIVIQQWPRSIIGYVYDLVNDVEMKSSGTYPLILVLNHDEAASKYSVLYHSLLGHSRNPTEGIFSIKI